MSFCGAYADIAKRAFDFYRSKGLEPVPTCGQCYEGVYDPSYQGGPSWGGAFTQFQVYGSSVCVLKTIYVRGVTDFLVYHEVGHYFVAKYRGVANYSWPDEALPQAMAAAALGRTCDAYFYKKLYKKNPYTADPIDWYDYCAVYLDQLKGAANWAPIITADPDKLYVEFLKVLVRTGKVDVEREPCPTSCHIEVDLDGLSAAYYDLGWEVDVKSNCAVAVYGTYVAVVNDSRARRKCWIEATRKRETVTPSPSLQQPLPSPTTQITPLPSPTTTTVQTGNVNIDLGKALQMLVQKLTSQPQSSPQQPIPSPTTQITPLPSPTQSWYQQPSPTLQPQYPTWQPSPVLPQPTLQPQQYCPQGTYCTTPSACLGICVGQCPGGCCCAPPVYDQRMPNQPQQLPPCPRYVPVGQCSRCKFIYGHLCCCEDQPCPAGVPVSPAECEQVGGTCVSSTPDGLCCCVGGGRPPDVTVKHEDMEQMFQMSFMMLMMAMAVRIAKRF